MLRSYSNSRNRFYILFILCSIGVWSVLRNKGIHVFVHEDGYFKQGETSNKTSSSARKKMVTFPFDEILISPISIKQDNELLIEEIREKYLKAPSKNDYVLVDSNVKETWQAKAAKDLSPIKKKGYFVECGANNGEYLSNTLSLEVLDDWNGLLIEADPIVYGALMKKNRKSQSINACLSPKPYPQKVNFHQEDSLGKIMKEDSINGKDSSIKLQCFPLYSILLAANRTQIDFFSLDVEGVELDVLKTIPWKDVQISTLSVEFNHVPEGKEAVKKYMEEIGYVMHIDGQTVSNANGQNVDYIFYHPQYVKLGKTIKQR